MDDFLVYIDTNVWLDYCLRTDQFLDVYAQQVLARSLSCEFRICVSDVLLYELNKYISSTDDLFELFTKKDKLVSIDSTYEDKQRARSIPVHYPDDVHLFLAQKAGCRYFITNDKEILAAQTPIETVSSSVFSFK